MTDSLPKEYRQGTHRAVTPEQTLARVTPHLSELGISRLADVSGLDSIGIPVYCAIRPRGICLQVANGKGLRPIDAKVSALMEAVEFHHFENPDGHCERRSLDAMQQSGRRVIPPQLLPDYRSDSFFSADYIIDWVEGEDLLSGEPVWLPASAAYICNPTLYNLSGNGVASGNHMVEATLHALYEAIERDSVASLSFRGRWTFPANRCRFVNLETVTDGPVQELRGRLASAGIKLVLLWIKGRFPVHNFMAVLLDGNALSQSSTINIGYGTHLSTSVAATRAITEAAQSRLAFIHGAREDLGSEVYTSGHTKAYRFFDGVEANSRWGALKEMAGNDLQEDYRSVLAKLTAGGCRDIFRVDMTRRPFDIPVVKVFVCGLRMNRNLV